MISISFFDDDDDNDYGYDDLELEAIKQMFLPFPSLQTVHMCLHPHLWYCFSSSELSQLCHHLPLPITCRDQFLSLGSVELYALELDLPGITG